MIVEGVVTTSPTLIDPSGRLVVIQDATAAIEVRLPASGAAGITEWAGQPLGPGAHLQVKGSVGHSYGAPRISASAVGWLGWAPQPLPLRISAAPGPAIEWRLVVVSGRLDAVHRLGDRWRADLIAGSTRIPVAGLTGAQIAVGRVLAGRRATIVGIVRRAYPSATDQRFAIDPRSVSDMVFEAAGSTRPAATDRGDGSAVSVATADAGASLAPPSAAFVDLRDLAARRGQTVRVGGLVTRIDGAIISLDDGTATGRLMLSGDAAAYLDLVEVGDPLEATGLAETDATGPYLLVTDPDGVTQTGDPGAAAAAAGGSPAAPGPAVGQSSPGGSSSTGAAGPGPAGDGTPGPSIDLLQALALALFGAMTGLLIALAIALALARRGVATARRPGPEDGPRARPTLGPS